MTFKLTCKENTLWWKHLPNLFCSNNILPLKSSSLNTQINSISRLVLIIFLIFFVVDWKYALLFFIISNIFITLYYLQKSRNMKKESYKNVIENFQDYDYDTVSIKQQKNITAPRARQFCGRKTMIDGPSGVVNNKEWVSPNQKLVGSANPKTKIAPIIVPPSNDLSYWKSNNLVQHSAVNTTSNYDAYNSGYGISTCCPPLQTPETSCRYAEKFQTQNLEQETVENYNNTENVIEPVFCQTSNIYNTGLVNMTCGYDQTNSKYNVPNNLSMGNCQVNNAMKDYNDNLFTQIIQPNVYTKNLVNEPINSNIGISFTQQIPPTTESNENGVVYFKEHDPYTFIGNDKNDKMSCVPENEPKESNVYDPRFSGYGTSYRSYIEKTTGQPRFYYDDVDTIRMPNYIVRSHIDVLPFADQYGPIPQGDALGNKYNANIRSMVNDAFADSAIYHRTDIQQAAMRKINAEKWQQRLAPLTKNGQRMMGGRI